MGMNPRTHPKGAAPDFTLPKPNPNPAVMTDALWWLVCMREELEPASQNGGTYANKPGHHNIGNNLPMPGKHSDSSITYSYDREGAWWRTKTAAHDWTFPDAQRGDFTTINRYTRRLINSMKDPNDTRPDHVYAYTLGQLDGDRVVEGYNERTDAAETSADESHNWHRHDSFRRNIVGSFDAMWKALTIDMGWTFAEWQRSVSEGDTMSVQDVRDYFKSAAQAVRDPNGAATSGTNRADRNDLAAVLRFSLGLEFIEQVDENLVPNKFAEVDTDLTSIEDKIDELLARSTTSG